MSNLSSTAQAALRDAQLREAKERGVAPPPERNPLDRWYPKGTAPKNGTIIKTKKGLVFRWLPYKKNSAEWVSGVEGRWQVRKTDAGSNSYWATARIDDPGEWRGVVHL